MKPSNDDVDCQWVVRRSGRRRTRTAGCSLFCGRGGEGGGIWRDRYSFHQSSARIHIEQAFGQLMWRWGTLWRRLRMPFAKRPLVIKAALLLHSVCPENDAAPLAAPGDAADERARMYLNDSGGPDAPETRA